MELVSSCVSTATDAPDGERWLFSPPPHSAPLGVCMQSHQGPLQTKIVSRFMQLVDARRGEKSSLPPALT